MDRTRPEAPKQDYNFSRTESDRLLFLRVLDLFMQKYQKISLHEESTRLGESETTKAGCRNEDNFSQFYCSFLQHPR